MVEKEKKNNVGIKGEGKKRGGLTLKMRIRVRGQSGDLLI